MISLYRFGLNRVVWYFRVPFTKLRVEISRELVSGAQVDEIQKEIIIQLARARQGAAL